MNTSALTQPQSAVPVEYAEKAMGSLMKLHGELMEEKERRVDLYRRLMEKEQALAELKMYVKLLEERLPSAAAPVAAPPVRPEPLRMVPSPRGTVPRPPPRPSVARGEASKGAAARSPSRPLKSRPAEAAAPAPRRTAEGWKSW